MRISSKILDVILLYSLAIALGKRSEIINFFEGGESNGTLSPVFGGTMLIGNTNRHSSSFLWTLAHE